MLLRTGLADGLELQLGWQGPVWQQHKYAGMKKETMVWVMSVLV